jgi:hypothetical protein
MCLLAGCTVSQEKKEDGTQKVELKSPMGNLKVNTEVTPADVGLSLYPGAKLKPKPDKEDSSSANVNINTPFFGFKVIALDYVSDDPPQKVIDFYKKDMLRYGKVIECEGTSGKGESVHANGGDFKLELNCDQTDKGNGVELKAGQGSTQHVVGVKPADNGKGSEFGLVYLQLRGEQETM